MTRLMLCIVALVIVMGAANSQGADYYVDQSSGSDANDGLSWINAKASIGNAISAGGIGSTINVAEGTYEEVITLKPVLILMGGYPAGGGDRKPMLHKTVIDGHGAGSTVTGADESAINGFWITGGTGTWPSMYGTVKGGGIWCIGTMSILNNVIYNNSALGNDIDINGQGGGIYIDGSGSPSIINNIIHHNMVGDLHCDGGAVYCLNSDARMVNNTIVDNYSPSGCVTFMNSNPVIINNIFASNTGIAIRESGLSPSPAEFYHNVFHDSSAVYYDAETSTTFTSVTSMDSTLPEAHDNFDCDPSFISPTDFHITMLSCCIDSGSDSRAPASDIDGENRPFGAGYDIGADEYHELIVPLPRILLIICMTAALILKMTAYSIR